MASFHVASLLVVLLVASYLSNLEAGRECWDHVDCNEKCRPMHARCNIETGKCKCIPWMIPVEDAKCSSKEDCIRNCPPGSKSHECQNGLCLCQ